MATPRTILSTLIASATMLACGGEELSDRSESREPTIELDQPLSEVPTGYPCPLLVGVYVDRAGVDDDDGDGLLNCQEEAVGTDPSNADSDGDGVPDDVELGDIRAPIDTDEDGTIDALDIDDDGDDVPTLLELGVGGWEDPLDTDEDGTPDYLDDDDDGDGCPTIEEGVLDTNGNGIPAYLDPEECVNINELPED